MITTIRIRRAAALLAPALACLALACNDSSSSSSDTTGGTTTDDPTTSTSTTVDATTMSTTMSTTSPPDSTEGPPENCPRTVRYPLYDGLGCGRIVVGDIDGDGTDDVVAFGRDPAAPATGAVPTALHTFIGNTLGLDPGDVHCCLEASSRGHGLVFDLNGDGRGDPIWASQREAIPGDPDSLVDTMEKVVRSPETGFTALGVLSMPAVGTAAFTVGRISQQVIGMVIVANGELTSLIGNGDGLGLDPVASVVLDPVPEVWAIRTMELDGQQGTDLAGLGPDGFLVWGGSLDGTFTQATVTALPGVYTEFERIDLDLNGNDSLVLFGAGEPVAIVEGDGDGALIISTTNTPVLDPPVTVIEVNDDLYPDLVGVSGGNLVMYRGDGEGFAAEPEILAAVGDATDLAFGDFDANSNPDIVLCDDQGLLVVYSIDG